MTSSLGEGIAHIDMGIEENQAELAAHATALDALGESAGTTVAIGVSLEASLAAQKTVTSMITDTTKRMLGAVKSLNQASGHMYAVEADMNDAAQQSALVKNGVEVMAEYVASLRQTIGADGRTLAAENEAGGHSYAATEHYAHAAGAADPVPLSKHHSDEVEEYAGKELQQLAGDVDTLDGRVGPLLADIEASVTEHEVVRAQAAELFGKISLLHEAAYALMHRSEKLEYEDGQLAARIGDAIRDTEYVARRISGNKAIIGEDLAPGAEQVISLATDIRNRA